MFFVRLLREGRPPDRGKPRGRQLSLEQGIRLRDLIAALLVVELGLSKCDTAFVLGLGKISERQVRKRLEGCDRRMM